MRVWFTSKFSPRSCGCTHSRGPNPLEMNFKFEKYFKFEVGFRASHATESFPRAVIAALLLSVRPVLARCTSSVPRCFLPCASLDFEVRWTRDEPLKSDPHTAKAKGRAAGNRSKCLLATNHTLITRTEFLIHGTAIKSQRNRLRNSNLTISNRR